MPTETTTQLPNPVLDREAQGWAELDKRLDIAEAELAREEAQAGANRPSLEDAGTQAPAAGKTEAEPPKELSQDQGTPEATKPTEPAKQEQQQTPPPTPEKKESKYDKERRRLDKSWQELEAEKVTAREEYRRNQELLANIAGKLQSTIQQINRPAEAPKPAEPEFAPEDYEKLAADMEKAGRYEEADAANHRARQLRVDLAIRSRRPPPSQPPPQAPPPPQHQQPSITQTMADDRFMAEQKSSWDKAKTEFPAIVQKGSVENQEMIKLLNERPDLLDHPQGPYYAAMLVSKARVASRVPDLEKELSTLKTKLAELEQATSVSGPGSSPPGQLGAKSFDDMSLEEQETELKRMIAQGG